MPTTTGVSPEARLANIEARARPFSRPVRKPISTCAAAAWRCRVAWCWRARISVGAISAACPPLSTALSIASNATTVLPLPDIPLQKPHHASGLRHIGGDLRDRETLRRCQRKAEPRFDAARQLPRPDEGPALLAMAARANQCDGELARKHLVIGEARARPVGRQQIGLGIRGMNAADRIGPGGPLELR